MAKTSSVIRESASQREDARDNPRLEWWRAAKFGMFIHWGLYAIPAGEWKGQPIKGIGEWIMKRAQIPVAEYEQLAKEFNPVKFSAKEWVSLAKAAGQKYMVLTSKHHDGFCLYKSDVGDYNIVDATPFGRDPIAELAEECARQGIKLGFYYSQTQDWHHPDGFGNEWDFDAAEQDFDKYLRTYVEPQVRELLTKYGPVCLIWFDTPYAITVEQSQRLVNLVHEVQPDCLVSGRIGNALGDYASAGDNKIPGELVEIDWETPATINDTWGFKLNDHNWKSTADMVRKLVDIVSRGGNYLLNVGPTAEGVIPKASVARLLGMGAWLDINGESVYDTGAGPLQELGWGRTTAKEGMIYLHVYDWPATGAIRLSGLGVDVKGAYLLGDSEKRALPISCSADAVVIQVPDQVPDPIDTVIVLETA